MHCRGTKIRIQFQNEFDPIVPYLSNPPMVVAMATLNNCNLQLKGKNQKTTPPNKVLEIIRYIIVFNHSASFLLHFSHISETNQILNSYEENESMKSQYIYFVWLSFQISSCEIKIKSLEKTKILISRTKRVEVAVKKIRYK